MLSISMAAKVYGEAVPNTGDTVSRFNPVPDASIRAIGASYSPRFSLERVRHVSRSSATFSIFGRLIFFDIGVSNLMEVVGDWNCV